MVSKADQRKINEINKKNYNEFSKMCSPINRVLGLRGCTKVFRNKLPLKGIPNMSMNLLLELNI